MGRCEESIQDALRRTSIWLLGRIKNQQCCLSLYHAATGGSVMRTPVFKVVNKGQLVLTRRPFLSSFSPTTFTPASSWRLQSWTRRPSAEQASTICLLSPPL
jgi:hypothetical protein